MRNSIDNNGSRTSKTYRNLKNAATLAGGLMLAGNAGCAMENQENFGQEVDNIRTTTQSLVTCADLGVCWDDPVVVNYDGNNGSDLNMALEVGRTGNDVKLYFGSDRTGTVNVIDTWVVGSNDNGQTWTKPSAQLVTSLSTGYVAPPFAICNGKIYQPGDGVAIYEYDWDGQNATNKHAFNTDINDGLTIVRSIRCNEGKEIIISSNFSSTNDKLGAINLNSGKHQELIGCNDNSKDTFYGNVVGNHLVMQTDRSGKNLIVTSDYDSVNHKCSGSVVNVNSISGSTQLINTASGVSAFPIVDKNNDLWYSVDAKKIMHAKAKTAVVVDGGTDTGVDSGADVKVDGNDGGVDAQGDAATDTGKDSGNDSATPDAGQDAQDAQDGQGGSGGQGGSAGASGEGGNGGEAGNAGNAGNAGEAGNAGTAGEAGSAGNAGNAGSAGEAGNAGAPDSGTDAQEQPCMEYTTFIKDRNNVTLTTCTETEIAGEISGPTEFVTDERHLTVDKVIGQFVDNQLVKSTITFNYNKNTKLYTITGWAQKELSEDPNIQRKLHLKDEGYFAGFLGTKYRTDLVNNDKTVAIYAAEGAVKGYQPCDKESVTDCPEYSTNTVPNGLMDTPQKKIYLDIKSGKLTSDDLGEIEKPLQETSKSKSGCSISETSKGTGSNKTGFLATATAAVAAAMARRKKRK